MIIAIVSRFCETSSEAREILLRVQEKETKGEKKKRKKKKRNGNSVDRKLHGPIEGEAERTPRVLLRKE